MTTMYSEFYKHESHFETSLKGNDAQGCHCCGLTSRYRFAEQAHGTCKFCQNFEAPSFLGKERLIADLALAPDEQVGITVSGGKDSIYMWAKLCEMLGADHVVAFHHHKVGLTHPYASENIMEAKRRLGSRLVIVEDHEMLQHFRRNLRGLLEDPRPEIVRMVLCTGCRYGITRALYLEGGRLGIRKFLSGASYLELAPFKEELIEDAEAVDNYLTMNPVYAYGDNIKKIRRDSGLKYKNNLSHAQGIGHLGDVALYDFDHYFPNHPERTERYVIAHMGWKRPERSWHFDCVVEMFKDVFYYGLLGYTESDFKLSAMVRHHLLTREEADHQLAVWNHRLANSLPSVLALLDSVGCSDLKPAMKSFFIKAPYLKGGESK